MSEVRPLTDSREDRPAAGANGRSRPASAFRRFVSRISFRLMAFNVLLVFLPVAGMLYLGSYESKLLAEQDRALREEARILSSALSASPDPSRAAQEILRQWSERVAPAAGRARPQSGEPVRLRVISPIGTVVADSGAFSGPPAEPQPSRARANVLYRVGAAIAKFVLGVFRATEPVLPKGDFYEASERLYGEEVRNALQGEPGRAERISPDHRSVTVYVAEPVGLGGRVIGAVLASQSTFTILQDLYTVRLGIIRIFVVSLVFAIVLSFLVATTIVGPLRQLRIEAGAILDRRGRLRGRFRGSRKHDEIGDLSRALERLTRRLDGHVRFIETFAADVSHEFKNPLASVRTATEMLAEVDEPAQRQRFLRMVEQDVARMESMLSGVREITLIDAQLTNESRQRVDVSTLLQRIVEGFRLREESRVEIALETAPGACVVEASEDRLIQAFVNVLENAISFSPDRGRVSVSAAVEDGNVLISIADEGPGVPVQNLERVFDRFFTHRPESARTRSSHTGLGLAITKAIVEGYGGTIVASNNSGRGARFEIRLPRA